MRLYRLMIPMYRSASLNESAVVTDEEWALIEAHNGLTLRFGEVAGKHSQVDWELDLSQFEILSQDEKEIEIFKKWFPSGGMGPINILDRIESLHEHLGKNEPCKCGYVYEE